MFVNRACVASPLLRRGRDRSLPRHTKTIPYQRLRACRSHNGNVRPVHQEAILAFWQLFLYRYCIYAISYFCIVQLHLGQRHGLVLAHAHLRHQYLAYLLSHIKGEQLHNSFRVYPRLYLHYKPFLQGCRCSSA